MPKLDLSHYHGREQAYVKHYLLQKYLPEWAYKVGTKWNSLAYIDGFAGPWGTTDPNHADSSFALAVDTLRECKLGLHSRGVALSTYAFLVESKKEAFAKLDSFARSANGSGVSVTAIPGKFVERIFSINNFLKSTGSQTFKFVLLDPMGWADIPMKHLQHLDLGSRTGNCSAKQWRFLLSLQRICSVGSISYIRPSNFIHRRDTRNSRPRAMMIM